MHSKCVQIYTCSHPLSNPTTFNERRVRSCTRILRIIPFHRRYFNQSVHRPRTSYVQVCIPPRVSTHVEEKINLRYTFSRPRNNPAKRNLSKAPPTQLHSSTNTTATLLSFAAKSDSNRDRVNPNCRERRKTRNGRLVTRIHD